MIPNLDQSNKEDLALDYMQSQMTDLRMMMDLLLHEGRKNNFKRNSLASIEYERISNRLEKLTAGKYSPTQAENEFTKLLHETDDIMMQSSSMADQRMFGFLLDRIRRQRDEYFSTL